MRKSKLLKMKKLSILFLLCLLVQVVRHREARLSTEGNHIR
jgi:hypothetical protein